ncbi:MULTISPECIES: alpha-hydroxy-acid oxidizing protein [unclassified Streptomyces]|uniref:alpha-hydroxy-acid oxidizing protein n=1 Tax=unclassified Streptomyces TaxID=2593676 RepID=UPI00344F9324
MTRNPAAAADGAPRNASPAGPPVRADRWTRSFHTRRDSTVRLVCFPHAGGAANSFAALSAALSEDVQLLAVQYPGRQDRHFEPCAEDIATLAEGVAGALASADDRPLFLLGHSMGALVAFETARLLEERGTVAGLFVSAARPPAQDWEEPDLDSLGDDDLVAGLRRLGGVPDALLRDPETLGEVLRVLRADHRLLRRYHCDEGTALRTPITVLLAAEDPKNALAQMREWSRHTESAYDVETIEGGHFALTERAGATAGLLLRRTAGTARPRDETPGTGTPVPADLVREIYLAGPTAAAERITTDLTGLDAAARALLTPNAYGYVSGNAGTGATARANRAAFDRWSLVPRMLRGVTSRDLSVSLFGQRLASPVLLAPVAAQTVVHPGGELAAVKGAARVGVPFVLSSFSCHTMEEVAREAGPGPRWFQLYWPSDDEVAESLTRRAEASGYSALVLTVDNPAFGYRPADLDHGYLPFVQGAGLANFASDPVFRASLPKNAGPGDVVRHWAAISANPGLTWDRLPRLRELTRLPILVKGVLHPDDARLALDRGADGIVVSNHGGRQLDGSIAALDALPAVRAAVGNHVPVLMDSGVRTGSDVVKALALGADAVLYGRPYQYGLALDGERGVHHVLRCLLAELDLALTLIGCDAVRAVDRDLLTPAGTAFGPVSPAGGAPGTRPAAGAPGTR